MKALKLLLALSAMICMIGLAMAQRTATSSIACWEHQTHHGGQSTLYLRLAGVTPPQERLFLT